MQVVLGAALSRLLGFKCFQYISLS